MPTNHEEPLNSKTEQLGELFSKNNFFKIPMYQRPFSWDDDQFDDLVTDLMKADRNQQYFLGSIVLHKNSDNLVVVDGQQRLTSLLILLACIRDRITAVEYKNSIQEKIHQKENLVDGIPEKVRLEVREANVFKDVVVKQGGTNKDFNLKDYIEPEKRYFSASKLFHERLSELNEVELQELSQFISQKCVVIKLTSTSFEQAFRLFEIVNDRGKQLRRIDILKANNISPDVIKSEATRTRIANKWHSLENEIGEDHFESVFFLVRMILVKDRPNSDLLEEFKNRVFGRNIVKRGEDFSKLMFHYIALYRSIFLDQDYLSEDDKPSRKFRSLIHIMDGQFRASEWKSCLLLYANKFGRNEFYSFVELVEKLFLTHWVAAVRKDERYNDYIDLWKAIEKAESPQKLFTEINYDAKPINEAAKRPDFYKAGYSKYLLLRLELLTTEHDVEKKFSAKSVEHVFPQNPKDDSDWLKSTGQVKLESFVHQLGNLVLISKSKNSSASNKEFEDKKHTYLANRVTDYPRSVEVLKYDTWSIEIIEKRTEEAVKKIMNPI